MSKHTSGPWSLRWDGIESASTGLQICERRAIHGDDAIEIDANARLIAAAPLLRETVETLLAAMDAGLVPRDALNGLLESRARAAIAQTEAA